MKHLKYCILATLSFVFFNTQAQLIKGQLNASLRADINMHLGHYEGNEIIEDETVELKNGQFVFPSKTRKSGVYVLYTTKKHKHVPFIIDKEPVFEVHIKDSGFRNFTIVQGEESKLYAAYIKREKALNKKVKPLKRQFASMPNGPEKQALDAKLNELYKTFFDETSVDIQKLPNSFFSKIVLSMDADNKTDRYQYFSDIDFTDERLIRTKVFSTRYRDYFMNYAKGDKYGFMDCVDDIMEKAKANQAVYEFSALTLINGFYNTSGFEEVVNYILDTYVFGEDCGGIKVGEYLKRQGESIQKLQVGSETFDINLKDINNQPKSLIGIAKENTYTLLMFWASTCKHCEEQMPEIKALYTRYQPKGFELFSFSIDEKAQAWKAAVQNNKTDLWINVNDTRGWDAPATDQFRIVKTPSFLLLDSRGRIVAKPRHVSEIKTSLEALDRAGGFSDN
ncbi:MAG: TlpA family protein disulfide reductase [Flavobacteriales bacterium]